MDSKTLNVLEYPKILGKLAGFCDFSASMELARALEPTDSFELAISRLAETTEARKILAVQGMGIGGAHDIPLPSTKCIQENRMAESKKTSKKTTAKK